MTRARLFSLLLLPLLGACTWAAPAGRYGSLLPAAARTAPPPVGMVSRAAATTPAKLPGDISRAIETRLAELERRGGACAEYGSVMERAYRQGRITIRPYMWRIEGRLVSGQASAAGDMVLARDIDPLNVGVRTVDDVLWSAEHESAHIAFRIANLEWAGLDLADRYVRACRSAAGADASGARTDERTRAERAISDR